MSSDRQVDLIFSHFTPRYIATGVDPNDLQRLIARIESWADWCRIWSDEAAKHEVLAQDALAKNRPATASEAWLRAAIMYHYGKHLFGAKPDEFAIAQAHMLRCYQLAAPGLRFPPQRLVIPYRDDFIYGHLRLPERAGPSPVAIILPGLDACKEELHSWSEPFLERGLATLTLDGPGQGEAAAKFPISLDWGGAMSAVLEVLAATPSVDAQRVGVVGQSLGAFYAPLSAAQEPRLKACIANCGPFNFGPVLPQMPDVSQDLFRIRAHLATHKQALEFAYSLNLTDEAPKIKCPMLIIFGAGDRIIPVSEGQLLADAMMGPSELVVYPEGNHVCFNIPYKFRPLTADWMLEHLQ